MAAILKSQSNPRPVNLQKVFPLSFEIKHSVQSLLYKSRSNDIVIKYANIVQKNSIYNETVALHKPAIYLCFEYSVKQVARGKLNKNTTSH